MYFWCLSVYSIVIYVSIVSASPGECVTLECSSNRTFSYINWYRNNTRVATTNRFTSGECGVFSIVKYVKYIKFTVGRCNLHVHQLIINNVNYTEDNGAHWNCNDSTTTNSFILSLVVLNSSEIKIELVMNVTTNQSMLICTAAGPPDNITFLPWKQYLNNQLVRTLDGCQLKASVLTLVISPDLQKDQGTYICRANNGTINNKNIQIDQTNSIQIKTAKPQLYLEDVSSISAVANQTINFQFNFTSFSETEVSWFHKEVILNQTGSLIISTEGTNIRHPYNQHVSISAGKSVLTIIHVRASDAGTYKGQVCNGNGCTSSTWHLLVNDSKAQSAETSPGESFTLDCSSNTTFSLIDWYRNNIHVASTQRFSSGECGVFSIVKNIKYIQFTVGRCDQHVHQLIINNVSYTEDNGAHWSCNSTTTVNSFILSVAENTATTATTANTETTTITETKSTTVSVSTTETTEPTENTPNTTTTDYSATPATTSITTATTAITTASTTTEQKEAKEGESETNLIIAGSVASVVLIIVLALVVIIVVNTRRNKSTETATTDESQSNLYASLENRQQTVYEELQVYENTNMSSE